MKLSIKRSERPAYLYAVKGFRDDRGGYLFLQKIYHELDLDKVSENICGKHKFEFDLDEILSKLNLHENNVSQLQTFIFRRIQALYRTANCNIL